MTVELAKRMERVLQTFKLIFTSTSGCATLTKHHIDTGDSPPVRCKLRPVNAKQEVTESCNRRYAPTEPDMPQHRPVDQSSYACGEKDWRLSPGYILPPAQLTHKTPAYPMPRTDWLLHNSFEPICFEGLTCPGIFSDTSPERGHSRDGIHMLSGTFEFTSLPFGVAGGPAMFQTQVG